MSGSGPQAEKKPVQFTQPEIDAMAAWVASLAPGPGVPEASSLTGGDPSNGAQLFRVNCAMCHNVAGAGGALTEGKWAPNLKNIDPSFMNPAYDAGRKMSAPYTWLVLGIGYRKSKVKGVPDSWKWLFDSDAYKGKIALLSESADLIRLAAKYKGLSVNNIPPEMVAEIEKMLIRQKPFVKAFHEDNGQDMLLSGEVDLVLEYNGDIAQIMSEDPDIGFVVPKEGSLINSDNLCIPVGAPRPNNAHAFINYLLDAEAGKKISETILYPTPNAAAKALMPDSYRNNPAIFPPADVMAKCEYGAFEGAAKASFYEEVVTRVRAA